MSKQSKTLKPEPRYWTVWYVVALLFAFAAAIDVFRYTGDFDVVLALGSAVGIGLFGWLAAHLHIDRPWRS